MERRKTRELSDRSLGGGEPPGTVQRCRDPLRSGSRASRRSTQTSARSLRTLDCYLAALGTGMEANASASVRACVPVMKPGRQRSSSHRGRSTPRAGPKPPGHAFARRTRRHRISQDAGRVPLQPPKSGAASPAPTPACSTFKTPLESAPHEQDAGHRSYSYVLVKEYFDDIF